MKSAIAILVSNLVIASTSLAAVSLSGGEGLAQPVGLIALGLVLVVGVPLLIARWPSYKFAPGPSPATATSAAFGMVHLP